MLKIKRAEEAELRSRYDELVVEMARQEKRLKQRIGSLDRSKRAGEQRLADVQNKVKNTVPKEDWNKLKHEHILLQEKYKMLIDKEQSALQERATTEGHRQMAGKLKIEQQELKMELAAATDRAEALTARLEHLALKDGPPEQQLLAVELARLQVLCDSLKAQNDNLGQENAALWKERAGLKEELGSVSFHVRALRPFVLPLVRLSIAMHCIERIIR